MSKIECLVGYEKVACGDKRLVQDVDNLIYEFGGIVTLDGMMLRYKISIALEAMLEYQLLTTWSSGW